MAATDIFVNIKGVDKISGMLDRVQGKVGKLGGMMGTALKAGAVAGGAAIVGGLVKGTMSAISFEKQMAEVHTLLGKDFPKASFEALNKDILNLSSEMGISTDEIIPALYQAISAGVPPDNVIDFLRTGAKASIGGVTDLETAIDGLTTITNAWGMESDKAGEIADVMFTGVKLGKTTMAELSASMFQAAPLAAALGISVEEVVGATATLTKSGVPTAQAMTQMRQAMVGMSKPTKEMSELLEIAGYETGEALIEAEGFTGAINVLTEAANNDKEVMAKAFGSVEALGFVLGVSGDNAVGAAADLAAVTDSAGASDEAFETMNETFSRQFQLLKNKLMVALTKLGLKILPVLMKALIELGKFIETVNTTYLPPLTEAFEAIWGAIDPVVDILVLLVKKLSKNKVIMKALGAVALTLVTALVAIKVAMVAWSVALKAAKAAQLLWSVATKAAAIAQWLLNAALTANPIGIVVVAIAALTAGLIYFFTQTEIGQKIITKTWGVIKSTFQSVLAWVKTNWPLLLAILTGPFGLAVYFIIKKKDAIIGIILGLKTKIVEIFTGVKDTVVGKFNEILAFLGGLPGRFSTAGSNMGQALANAVKGGLNAMITFFERGLNRIIGVWNSLEFKVPKVKLGPLGSIGGGTIGVPDIPYVKIPRLQEGALDIADDMLAQLHKGEMVIPRAFADALRTQLTMARSPAMAATAGAGGAATLNFYGDINLSGKATREDAISLLDTVEHEWRARRRRGR